MPDQINSQDISKRVRTSLFLVSLLIITLVMDGLPQVASAFVMQVVLLPLTIVFLAGLFYFLHGDQSRTLLTELVRLSSPQGLLRAIGALELCFIVLFLYETHYYSALGYRLLRLPTLLTFSAVLLALTAVVQRPTRTSPWTKFAVFAGAYTSASILAIVSFPLNYLRSDMLPVIFWAGRALLSGQNPYQHFYVADRIYDFPYLPGVLLAFAPIQALHLDLRWAGIVYIVAGMSLVYWATATQYRSQAVLLIGLFVVCPYLQYRHELYTQSHFFSLILVFVLMQRRHFSWAAAAFALTMLISQFSWVIFRSSCSTPYAEEHGRRSCIWPLLPRSHRFSW